MRAPSAGWRLICSYSSARQRVGLLQDVVGQPDLADVVEQRAEADDGHLGFGQLQLPRDHHRRLADALRVAGRVRVAGVERRRQRADGAEVGGARFGFGRRQPAHQLVEAGGERVELAALARGLHGAAEVARRGHRRDGVRHAVDRIGQRPRQPQAGERREHERPERDGAEREQGAARGRRAPRRRSTTACRRATAPIAISVRIAYSSPPSAIVAAQLAGGRDDGAGERLGHRAGHHHVVHGDDDAGVGQAAQVLRVGVVEAGGDHQRAHRAIAARAAARSRSGRRPRARWRRRCSASSARLLQHLQPGRPARPRPAPPLAKTRPSGSSAATTLAPVIAASRSTSRATVVVQQLILLSGVSACRAR